MSEWRRVFINPGRLGLLLLLTLLGAALFVGSHMKSIGPGEFRRALDIGKYRGLLTEKWKEEEPERISQLAKQTVEQLKGRENYFESSLWMYAAAVEEIEADADYIAGYTDYLNQVQRQAEEQSKTSIFGRPNSFSMRNLKKTAQEFGRLLGREGREAVSVRFSNNSAIGKWLDYQLGDYFTLLMIIVFAMSFLEERKKGLWTVIRTTHWGRVRLGLQRTLILLVSSGLTVLLFTFLPLYFSTLLNGGHMELDRAIQSVQNFRTCTIRTTIGGWLLLYFAVKTLAGFFLGLFIWFLMGSVTNVQLALAVLVPVLGVEYALFRFLPVQSFLNAFKYLNLFSYVHTSALYTNYLNIDFFSFPVGNRQLMLFLLPLLLIVFGFLCVRMQAKRYPEGRHDLLSSIALRLNRILDAGRRRFSAGMWETYKWLFPEFGIVLVLLIVIAVKNMGYGYWEQISDEDRSFYLYVKDMQGPIDEDTDSYLEKARENAEQPGHDPALLSVLDRVESRVTDLRARGQQAHFTPWMVYDLDFNAYYGTMPRDRQRLNAMIAILFLVLLTAGLHPYETQSGVVPMLRSLWKGRSPLLRNKILLAILLSIFVWAAVYLREAWMFISTFGKDILDAPIGNLDAFSAFPFRLTVRGYLMLLYGMRLWMLLMTAYASLYVSSFVPSMRMAYLVETAVLVLPALLTVLGVSFFRFVSPVVPVSSAELFLQMGAGKWWYMIPWIIWAAAGHAALICYRIRWIKSSS